MDEKLYIPWAGLNSKVVVGVDHNVKKGQFFWNPYIQDYARAAENIDIKLCHVLISCYTVFGVRKQPEHWNCRSTFIPWSDDLIK